MRGKVGSTATKFRSQGITPAYAGKRFTVSASSASVKDHPRLCGEKVPVIRSGFHKLGSPPPMRGKGIP